MRIPKIIPGEEVRLEALHEFDPLDGKTDDQLDEVVGLASRLFDVPISLVSLVDRDRQVFAGRTGLAVCETSRDVSFCAHELESDDVLVILDATLDPRFFDNPLVTGDPNIRFYAGASLRSASGQVLGRLCIIDHKPRSHFSDLDRKSLKDLARLAMDRLEHRRLVIAGEAGQSRFRNIAATSPDAIVCADHDGLITFWNATAQRLFGFSADEAVGSDLDLIVPQSMRGGHGGGLKRVVEGGKPRLVGKTIELEALRKDGTTFPIELSLSMWKDGATTSFGAIMRDISERRRNEDRLYRMAHHDVLTGLPNRGVVAERIREALERGTPVHLLLVDLDGFKGINDTLGHATGDILLRHVATRLQNCVRITDTVARLGGDEFAILLHGIEDGDGASLVADCVIASLSSPFSIDGQLAHIGASVGVAAAPRCAVDADTLLSNADMAMYQAKREGRRCTRFYSDRLREEALKLRAFEGELRRAIEQCEFTLFYQPQVDLRDGRLIGAEALIRWQHPSRGLLHPADFLSAVENSLMAVELGRWTLETACLAASAWRARLPDFQIGVNLFEAQFGGNTLAKEVRDILDQTGLPAAGLELEVTENIILRHDKTMLEALKSLHDEGVAIAFDDFGTGFASLSMLKTYPLDRLKIDRSFVTDICTSPTDALIVQAVAALGQGLGIDVIAEGIENTAQRDLLYAAGCKSGQGYLFGQPIPAEAFDSLIEDASLTPLNAGAGIAKHQSPIAIRPALAG